MLPEAKRRHEVRSGRCVFVTRFATRIVINRPLGDTKGSMVVSGSRKRW